MKKILIITASVNGENGSSTKAAHNAEKKLKAKYKEASFEYIDLNKSEFAKNVLTSETMGTYFSNSIEWINKLKETDVLVFSTNMTNFGYTAPVKNFIDKVCVARESFKYKYDGSGLAEGLITKPQVILITSQGAPKGWYPFGDHTVALVGTFKFLGLSVLDPIVIAGTKTSENHGKTSDDFVQMVDEQITKTINAL